MEQATNSEARCPVTAGEAEGRTGPSREGPCFAGAVGASARGPRGRPLHRDTGRVYWTESRVPRAEQEAGNRTDSLPRALACGWPERR